MVCVYCGSETSVVNSRPQRKSNGIWRRRRCLKCGAIFTTQESIDLSGALTLQKKDGQLLPFSKDKLFVSIFDSCRHRPKSSDDAAYLTQTVIDKVLPFAQTGILEQGKLIALVIKTLENFDKTAAAVYSAYHLHKNG